MNEIFEYPRNGLNIYTPGKLESIFTEIVCPESSKHHSWMYL